MAAELLGVHVQAAAQVDGDQAVGVGPQGDGHVVGIEGLEEAGVDALAHAVVEEAPDAGDLLRHLLGELLRPEGVGGRVEHLVVLRLIEGEVEVGLPRQVQPLGGGTAGEGSVEPLAQPPVGFGDDIEEHLLAAVVVAVEGRRRNPQIAGKPAHGHGFGAALEVELAGSRENIGAVHELTMLTDVPGLSTGTGEHPVNPVRGTAGRGAPLQEQSAVGN